MDEHRIYFDELKYGDIKRIAEEFGTEPEYVSRAINGDDSPLRRGIRWIRSFRAVRPKAADRLEAFLFAEIKKQIETYEPVGNWNHDEEVRSLYTEVTQGFDCALRNGSPRELRRELLSDIRQRLDRWERRLDEVERTAGPVRVQK